MKAKTISVNGTVYDAYTGMPVKVERSEQPTPNAAAVHITTQKSTTLNRKYVTHPTVPSQNRPRIIGHTSIRPLQSAAARPASITRFERNQAIVAAMPKGKAIADFGPAEHPIAQRVAARHANAPVVVRPSSVIKAQAIEQATLQMPAKPSAELSIKKQGIFGKVFGVAIAALAIVALGGYAAYTNMPALSTKVAAAQAGINAAYPTYHPTGYRLAGPVSYTQDSVVMNFAANASNVTYTLSQSKTPWDSLAVLDKYVIPKSNGKYTAAETHGLTVYRFGTGAAWVNAGILYTINGTAELSNEQIGRIAASL